MILKTRAKRGIICDVYSVNSFDWRIASIPAWREVSNHLREPPCNHSREPLERSLRDFKDLIIFKRSKEIICPFSNPCCWSFKVVSKVCWYNPNFWSHYCFYYCLAILQETLTCVYSRVTQLSWCSKLCILKYQIWKEQIKYLQNRPVLNFCT